MKTQIPQRVSSSPVPTDACGLAATAELIGDKWSLLVLRAALYGVRRFSDFAAETGASRSVLSERLARLVDRGLLEEAPYRDDGARERTEYLPTTAALELRVAFAALTEWGARWLDEKPAQCIDRRSGDPVSAALVGPSGRRVDLRHVRVSWDGE